MPKRLLPLLCAFLAVQTLYAQTTAQKIDTLLYAYHDQHQFSGTALVAVHGQILVDKAYGPANVNGHTLNTTSSQYQLASVTKTFTSTLILKLAELHQLSLDDAISKFYPDYPHGDSITIRQLLSHTSGIFNYTRLDRDLWHPEQPATEEKMIALFKDKPLDFSPGTGWNYSNSGYSMLGYIVHKATGMPWEAAVRKYIFKPAGMQHSGFDFAHLQSSNRTIGYVADSLNDYTKISPLVDSSVSFSAGAIYSTTGDLYRFHQALQQNRIISAQSIALATTPVKNHYGFGWEIDSLFGHKAVMHSGGIFGFRSQLLRVPEDDICIILLSNTETPALNGIAKSILAACYQQPYYIPTKKVAIKLSEDILKNYTGMYKITVQSLLVELKLENGQLVAYPDKGPRSPMSAADNTHFFLDNEAGFDIEFVTDNNGNATAMRITRNGETRVAPKQ